MATRKTQTTKTDLLVDEEAAEVVKSIYHWFVNEGYSKMGIAKGSTKWESRTPKPIKRKRV